GRDPAGAQGADDAEEARVAGGQHGGGAFMCGDDIEGLVQVLEFPLLCVRWDGGGPQGTGRADDQPRAGQRGGRPGCPCAAVATDYRDVHVLLVHALLVHALLVHALLVHALLVHAVASAILVWPVKSTMMTRICGGSVSGPAASALNRRSTRAA